MTPRERAREASGREPPFLLERWVAMIRAGHTLEDIRRSHYGPKRPLPRTVSRWVRLAGVDIKPEQRPDRTGEKR